MALVRAQVKAFDFKRNYGNVKRSCDLLPVRPCRLQVDNNVAQLLPESWMRNWRNRTFVQSMVSFVVAFLHEHVLAQLDFLKRTCENTSLRASCSCDGFWILSYCRLLTFGSFSRHLQTVSRHQHPRSDNLTPRSRVLWKDILQVPWHQQYLRHLWCTARRTILSSISKLVCTFSVIRCHQ